MLFCSYKYIFGFSIELGTHLDFHAFRGEAHMHNFCIMYVFGGIIFNNVAVIRLFNKNFDLDRPL